MTKNCNFSICLIGELQLKEKKKIEESAKTKNALKFFSFVAI